MNRLLGIFKFIKAGQNENTHSGIFLLHITCQLQTIHIRHLNIRNYHIRLYLF